MRLNKQFSGHLGCKTWAVTCLFSSVRAWGGGGVCSCALGVAGVSVCNCALPAELPGETRLYVPVLIKGLDFVLSSVPS